MSLMMNDGSHCVVLLLNEMIESLTFLAGYVEVLPTNGVQHFESICIHSSFVGRSQWR